jgi:hypothetical protein
MNFVIELLSWILKNFDGFFDRLVFPLSALWSTFLVTRGEVPDTTPSSGAWAAEQSLSRIFGRTPLTSCPLPYSISYIAQECDMMAPIVVICMSMLIGIGSSSYVMYTAGESCPLEIFAHR